MEFTCNAISYNRMELSSCPVNDECSEEQFELNGRCFDNDRKLDYIRCYHKQGCAEDSEDICKTIGCENVMCDFDSTEIINMFNKCQQCDDKDYTSLTRDIVGNDREQINKRHYNYTVYDDDIYEISGKKETKECLNGPSLSETWKTLSNKKQQLIADFILPGSDSLAHEDGTHAAFEAVASDFTKREYKKKALMELPLMTSYEEVCCLGGDGAFPDLITPEYVISEFTKQLNFSKISCRNHECGPPPVE